ncbi:MAG TPA: c-type cytochrome [Thermoanaerobaculia bacterium]|nr:c-type cytochrome [Thermoanaerobaculia bacterium]
MRTLVLAILVLFATNASTDSPKESPEVTELMKSIAGKENRPSSEVFKNVKLLKDVPAGKLLRIMDAGYSRALGVGCDHCHVEERWDADDKRPKRAAREMIMLVNDINAKLETMEDIDNTEPAVNCTTCHRGYVKPALQMR